MQLTEILKHEGTHIWAFRRYSDIKNIADAHRRVQSCVARPPYDKAKVTVGSVIITDTKDYSSEPALVINVSMRDEAEVTKRRAAAKKRAAERGPAAKKKVTKKKATKKAVKKVTKKKATKKAVKKKR